MSRWASSSTVNGQRPPVGVNVNSVRKKYFCFATAYCSFYYYYCSCSFYCCYCSCSFYHGHCHCREHVLHGPTPRCALPRSSRDPRTSVLMACLMRAINKTKEGTRHGSPCSLCFQYLATRPRLPPPLLHVLAVRAGIEFLLRLLRHGLAGSRIANGLAWSHGRRAGVPRELWRVSLLHRLWLLSGLRLRGLLRGQLSKVHGRCGRGGFDGQWSPRCIVKVVFVFGISLSTFSYAASAFFDLFLPLSLALFYQSCQPSRSARAVCFAYLVFL